MASDEADKLQKRIRQLEELLDHATDSNVRLASANKNLYAILLDAQAEVRKLREPITTERFNYLGGIMRNHIQIGGDAWEGFTLLGLTEGIKAVIEELNKERKS